MKRARTSSSGGSVTGGTMDIKPQLMTITGTTQTTDQYNVVKFSLPQVRTTRSLPGKSIILEILKIYWSLPDVNNGGDVGVSIFATLATNSLNRNTADTSTNATYKADVSDSNALASIFWSQAFTTSGVQHVHSPQVSDLTDENGNGVLVATDNLFFIAGNVSMGTAGFATCKVLYRFVAVNLEEYIGIVQSQN